MEKRFFLAIALSFLVLLAYSFLFSKTKPIVQQEVIKENITLQTPLSTESKPQLLTHQNLSKSNINKELYKFDTQDFVFWFSKKGAYITRIYDKEFSNELNFSNIGLVPGWIDLDFIVKELPKGVEFVHRAADGREIRKIFKFEDDGFFDFDIRISNVTDFKSVGYDIICSAIAPDQNDAFGQRYYEAFFQNNNVVSRKIVYGLKNPVSAQGNIEWAGLRDRYFCLVYVPEINTKQVLIGVDNKIPYIQLHIDTPEQTFRLYLGPQDEKKLAMLGKGAERVVNFGFFDLIAKGILWLLTVINKVLHNWGWSIIFITGLIYFVLFPLSFKSMLSMRKMQSLQPKVEALKAKFKDNPQKLQVATMELYREEKVNPLGGCLPMLLQIPVFFSLYQILMRLPELRGAHFLWIKDLSSPDRLFVLPKPIPFIGSDINILPLFMALVMFFQQKLSMGSKNMTGTAAEQQKMLTIMMPVLFGVLFYKMPSGLVLYWLFNSLLMLIFQWKISLSEK